MKLALEILAVTFAGIVNHGLGAYFYIKYPDYANHYNKFDYLVSRWAYSLFTIFVVLLVAYSQPDGFASIGIHLHQGGNNIGVILIGYFVCFICVVILHNTQKVVSRIKKNNSHRNLIHQRHQFQEFYAIRINGNDALIYLFYPLL